MNLYKRRFPKASFEQGVIDFLRLSPKQFKQVQDVAAHWSGGPTFHETLSPHPPSKLLPESLHKIQQHDQGTLAALMHLEKQAHDDHTSNVHMGGGIYETGRSILSSLWNMIGTGPEFSKLFETLGFKKSPKKLSLLEHEYADLVAEAYRPQNKRKGTHVHGMGHRQPDLGDDRFTVFVDDENKRVHIGLRGTTANWRDLGSDIRIVANNRSGHEQEIKDSLRATLLHYYNTENPYKFDISGHSLGATELLNIFTDPETGASDPVLQQVDRINLFNPGITPSLGLDSAKRAVQDNRFHFYLNDGDLISNAVTPLLEDDTYVRWGTPAHNPLANHSISQWQDEV